MILYSFSARSSLSPTFSIDCKIYRWEYPSHPSPFFYWPDHGLICARGGQGVRTWWTLHHTQWSKRQDERIYWRSIEVYRVWWRGEAMEGRWVSVGPEAWVCEVEIWSWYHRGARPFPANEKVAFRKSFWSMIILVSTFWSYDWIKQFIVQAFNVLHPLRSLESSTIFDCDLLLGSSGCRAKTFDFLDNFHPFNDLAYRVSDIRGCRSGRRSNIPKTTCAPSNQEVTTVVMKNCDPLVFLPALAMERRPGLLCFSLKFSSVKNELNEGYFGISGTDLQIFRRR